MGFMKKTMEELVAELRLEQDPLRKRFFALLQKKPRTFKSIAKEMAMSSKCLSNWLYDTLPVNVLSMMKIKAWIEKHERELNV